MKLKTNVIRREYRFGVSVEDEDRKPKYFVWGFEAESEAAALLQLKSYLESRNLKLIECHAAEGGI